jgi:hypothetical protein
MMNLDGWLKITVIYKLLQYAKYSQTLVQVEYSSIWSDLGFLGTLIVRTVTSTCLFTVTRITE